MRYTYRGCFVRENKNSGEEKTNQLVYRDNKTTSTQRINTMANWHTPLELVKNVKEENMCAHYPKEYYCWKKKFTFLFYRQQIYLPGKDMADYHLKYCILVGWYYPRVNHTVSQKIGFCLGQVQLLVDIFASACQVDE